MPFACVLLRSVSDVNHAAPNKQNMLFIWGLLCPLNICDACCFMLDIPYYTWSAVPS